MKNIIIVFISLLVMGCHSNRIDLTGKFDIAVDNEISGILTLYQEKNNLTGFFQWNSRGSSTSAPIYEVKGTIQRGSKPKEIKIYVMAGIPLYTFDGVAGNSNSIVGTFIQDKKYESKKYPSGTRSYAGTHRWLAMRK